MRLTEVKSSRDNVALHLMPQIAIIFTMETFEAKLYNINDDSGTTYAYKICN